MKAGIELFLTFFGRLLLSVEPSESTDARVQLEWRRSVARALGKLAMGVIIICGVLIGGWAWAQGAVPGMSGVALSSDLERLKSDITKRQDQQDGYIKVVRLLVLNSAIRQAQVDVCTAKNRRNGQALRLAKATLDGLADQYHQIKGYQIDPLDCDTVLITNNTQN